jgi:biotin synthase
MPEDFFNMPLPELFEAARRVNALKAPLAAAPTIVEERCQTFPPCRHCKWEYFKRWGIQTGRRRSREETLEWAKMLDDQGIPRTFIAGGWQGRSLPVSLLDYVRLIKENTGLEIFGLFGALDRASLAALKEAGLKGYLCGLESPNEGIYRRFRPGGDSLEDRKQALWDAKDLGLDIWSGFLLGLGESEEDVAEGIRWLKDIQPQSLSVLPFTPFPDTCMEGENPANPFMWARMAAIASLCLPGADIFTDPVAGIYNPYARLFMPNGIYKIPVMKERLSPPDGSNSFRPL